MTTTRSTRKSRDLRAEVQALKRERVLMAAAELFFENGYEHTTLEAVGVALGVTKPVIYSHYATKADLLAAICERGISSAMGAMDTALSREQLPREQLELLGKLFVRAVLDNRMHIAIFAREEKNLSEADFQRISQLRRDFDGKLRQLLHRGVEAGVFRISDCDIVALAIGGMVSWAYEWYRPDGRLSGEQIGNEFSRLILNMVCCTPTPT
jgi:Transcriptional regulator